MRYFLWDSCRWNDEEKRWNDSTYRREPSAADTEINKNTLDDDGGGGGELSKVHRQPTNDRY